MWGRGYMLTPVDWVCYYSGDAGRMLRNMASIATHISSSELTIETSPRAQPKVGSTRTSIEGTVD